MAPLSSLLAEACAKMKPPLDPAHATLICNKKPLTDLSCPFRLANIPNGSSLMLLYAKPGAPPERIAAAAGGSAASTANAAQPAPSQQPQLPSAPAAAAIMGPAAANPQPCTSAVAAPANSANPAAASGDGVALGLTSEQGQQQTSCDMEMLPTAAAPQPSVKETAAPAPLQPMDLDVAAAALNTSIATTAMPPNHTDNDAAGSRGGGTTAAADASTADANGGSIAENAEADHLGLGRTSAIFSREALEAAQALLAAAARSANGSTGTSSSGDGGGTGGAGEAAEGEDFFEVTQEDLASMMRSSQVRRMQEEAAGFRTRAAREMEERAKALLYSHVAIRAHLPGDLILQATFAATESIGALRTAVLSVLSPSLGPAVYLYTTPPRQVLHPDQDHHSLYQAGLVPAAHVHVGLDEKKAAAAGHTMGASVLRPEMAARVRSCIGPELAAFHGSRPAQAPAEERKRQGTQKEDPGNHVGAGVAVAGGAAGSGATTAGGGAKVPKWLKLGTK
ncbi:hypothetical protein Vafri_13075 [Volvox africanus]|nr:hypothetical protein Vafri_13075 [Volvox africanus]